MEESNTQEEVVVEVRQKSRKIFIWIGSTRKTRERERSGGIDNDLIRKTKMYSIIRI